MKADSGPRRRIDQSYAPRKPFLEAPLCDVDLAGEDITFAEPLLYCGLTRATVVCDVLATEGGALTKGLQRAAR